MVRKPLPKLTKLASIFTINHLGFRSCTKSITGILHILMYVGIPNAEYWVVDSWYQIIWIRKILAITFEYFLYILMFHYYPFRCNSANHEQRSRTQIKNNMIMLFKFSMHDSKLYSAFQKRYRKSRFRVFCIIFNAIKILKPSIYMSSILSEVAI